MKTRNVILVVLFIAIQATVLNAGTVYPLMIFTNTGGYFDDSNLDLYVEVTSIGSMVDFEIHNDSSIDSCIAAIYFDDSSMLSFDSIYESTGLSFNTSATPQNLPARNELTPSIETDYSFGANNPAPHKGINPGLWLGLRFNLTNATFSDVTEALGNGSLRIGAHVIALPDGSSESAVTPEPATVCLLGLGGLGLLRRREREFKIKHKR